MTLHNPDLANLMDVPPALLIGCPINETLTLSGLGVFKDHAGFPLTQTNVLLVDVKPSSVAVISLALCDGLPVEKRKLVRLTQALANWLKGC